MITTVFFFSKDGVSDLRETVKLIPDRPLNPQRRPHKEGFSFKEFIKTNGQLIDSNNQSRGQKRRGDKAERGTWDWRQKIKSSQKTEIQKSLIQSLYRATWMVRVFTSVASMMKLVEEESEVSVGGSWGAAGVCVRNNQGVVGEWSQPRPRNRHKHQEKTKEIEIVTLYPNVKKYCEVCWVEWCVQTKQKCC